MPSHVNSADIDTNQNSSVSSSFFFTQSNLPRYIHPTRTTITHRPSRREAQVQTYHTFTVRLQPNEPYTGFMSIGSWPALIGTESSTPTPPPAHSKRIEWKLNHIDRMEKCTLKCRANKIVHRSKSTSWCFITVVQKQTLVNSTTLTLGVCVRKSVFLWWPCVKKKWCWKDSAHLTRHFSILLAPADVSEISWKAGSFLVSFTSSWKLTSDQIL